MTIPRSHSDFIRQLADLAVLRQNEHSELQKNFADLAKQQNLTDVVRALRKELARHHGTTSGFWCMVAGQCFYQLAQAGEPYTDHVPNANLLYPNNCLTTET